MAGSKFIVGLTNEEVDKPGTHAESGLEELKFELLNFASDEARERLACAMARRVAVPQPTPGKNAWLHCQKPEECLKF